MGGRFLLYNNRFGDKFLRKLFGDILPASCDRRCGIRELGEPHRRLIMFPGSVFEASGWGGNRVSSGIRVKAVRQKLCYASPARGNDPRSVRGSKENMYTPRIDQRFPFDDLDASGQRDR